MDHFTSTEKARPWWDEVAHLRGADDRVASNRPTSARLAARASETTPVREYESADEPAIGKEPRRRSAPQRRAPTAGRRAERDRTDWFAQDAGSSGRRTKSRVDLATPQRPRAKLTDLAPDHAFMRRAQQVRRQPGERPTVTITGRPEAALPPQVREPQRLKARRTREQASAFVSSPDRLILWAVALGLLMILASIGTANADAAAPLTLLR